MQKALVVDRAPREETPGLTKEGQKCFLGLTHSALTTPTVEAPRDRGI